MYRKLVSETLFCKQFIVEPTIKAGSKIRK